MSEEEGDAQAKGFLSRWSRRKAASRDVAAPEPPAAAEAPITEPLPELPAIETLGADSDYTVFLARGVSRAVQAQALRVAWSSDPAIAGFRGHAEYAWDFNAPGYGALAPGDDAAEWLSQIVRSGAKLLATGMAETAGEADAAALPVPPTVVGPVDAIAAAASPVLVTCVAPTPVQDAPEAVALPTATSDAVASPTRRRHGGAVPA